MWLKICIRIPVAGDLREEIPNQVPLHVFSFKSFLSCSLNSIVQAAVIGRLLLGAAKATSRDLRKK
jgi:hypothetical protein